jgi:hypothetical protein
VQYLKKVMTQAPIDVCRDPSEDRLAVLKRWKAWQIELFALLLRHFALRDRYAALGYDLSFLAD